MILGQLIQAGRRFCECRSRDFIPSNEDVIVVIAYSIHDEFHARSFDIGQPGLADEIQAWLRARESFAWLYIQKEAQSRQIELPRPVGRQPMDRIYLTAATETERETVQYLLEPAGSRDACRLVMACSGRHGPLNLASAPPPTPASYTPAAPYLPHFASSFQ